MNTTALLVDILIIGIQILIWVFGLLLSFIFSPFQVVTTFEKSPTLFSILLIVFAYTLGIIFDYIIASVFKYFKSNEERTAYREGLVIRIFTYDKDIQKFLDNQYARLRIAKATIFNIPLIILSLVCYINANGIGTRMSNSSLILIIIALGLTLFILAILSYRMRNKTYWGYIKNTIESMEKK